MPLAKATGTSRNETRFILPFPYPFWNLAGRNFLGSVLGCILDCSSPTTMNLKEKLAEELKEAGLVAAFFAAAFGILMVLQDVDSRGVA